jgi:hypothetical protein
VLVCLCATHSMNAFLGAPDLKEWDFLADTALLCAVIANKLRDLPDELALLLNWDCEVLIFTIAIALVECTCRTCRIQFFMVPKRISQNSLMEAWLRWNWTWKSWVQRLETKGNSSILSTWKTFWHHEHNQHCWIRWKVLQWKPINISPDHLKFQGGNEPGKIWLDRFKTVIKLLI